MLHALGLLGVNYRWGGESPETGLDCSGLVRHVFRGALGLMLPRRAEEMSRAGAQIDGGELKPGDLVFFNTLRRAYSHVGIYIGNSQFVHAPSTGGKVRVEQLNASYWASRFNGARRIPGVESAPPIATGGNMVASAAPGAGLQRLREAAAQRSERAQQAWAAEPRNAPAPVTRSVGTATVSVAGHGPTTYGSTNTDSLQVVRAAPRSSPPWDEAATRELYRF